MNFANRNAGVIATIAIVIAIVACLLPVAQPGSQPQPVQNLGGVSNYDTIAATSLVLGCPNSFNSGCSGIAPSAGISFLPSVGAINGTIGSISYAASSTLFAVQNPFAATSTALVQIIGTGQATTSSLIVGTSTTATGLSTNANAPLVNSTNGVATTTQFTVLSGFTGPLGSGQISSGSNTVQRIVVGPSEFVYGFSTSTATGAGAANYTPGFTGTYKILWQN